MDEPVYKHRFDMFGAYNDGDTRHPQEIIRDWYPDAYEFDPRPIGDCWLFKAALNPRSPEYFSVVVCERPAPGFRGR